jgi:hypothetical protein
MKKNKSKNTARKRELTKEETKGITGGIGTIPLPEHTALKLIATRYIGTVMIGTWPQPEKVF